MTLKRLDEFIADHSENHATQLRARRAQSKAFKAGAK